MAAPASLKSLGCICPDLTRLCSPCEKETPAIAYMSQRNYFPSSPLSNFAQFCIIKKLENSLFPIWKRSATYGSDRAVHKYECFYILKNKKWKQFAKIHQRGVGEERRGTHGCNLSRLAL